MTKPIARDPFYRRRCVFARGNHRAVARFQSVKCCLHNALLKMNAPLVVLYRTVAFYRKRIPRFNASVTACVRSFAPSFARMLLR